jgi:hypothetical protein
LIRVYFFLLLILCSFGAHEAYGSAKIDAIGISIEKTLRISGKLTYSDISYLDDSPKTIGKLGKDGRIATPKQDNPEWLRFQQSSIIVDPPGKIADRIKMIHIVSSLDAYMTPDQMTVKENTTKSIKDYKPTQSVRVYSHTRSVDSHCTTATITAKDWKFVLEDTIQYLKSGCTDTKIDTIGKDIKPITKHDIPTSAKYKLDKFYDTVKKDCTKKRNACTILDNKAVSTMGDSR